VRGQATRRGAVNVATPPKRGDDDTASSLIVHRSNRFTTREAESGNGMRQPDIINERWRAESNDLESNAKGVLLLLLSARASLLRHGANEACLKTIEDCVLPFACSTT
jgi:hypothetical protein